ncbi:MULTISPECIES: hypothetical protein [Nocardiaceae]|jgi:hypothetical protein|uniref:hypothetical protein n=1 Tax=Nocardiaceae TaxID=85025 RepID=UPI000565BEB7|nr:MULTISPECIES: hypothetical protein [Rhodococcus]OZF03531.1 hypothetical protein CH301_08990 [Rhodococcus sp. 15-1189-1-1a]OZF17335.1 hypothetical protein CH299_09540 [Rhodococcus sp. 14-2686-1-2]OZF54875.1 hypothetical protein CH293_09355 [Rhodococcus sp. 14-2470-1b]OZF54969.1 hypothetical protein CH293_09870 [Rhodococcus sp. 14-2470-1b]
MSRSAEHTAARRAVARKHHPDVGGDPAVYAAELAAVDRRFSRAPTTIRRRTWKHYYRRIFGPAGRLRSKRYFDI